MNDSADAAARPTAPSPVTESARRQKRARQTVITLALLAFLALLASNRWRQDTVARQATGLAPDFELVTFEGETIRLADVRGQGVVLNFWASWCGPCRDEAPHLETAWRRERENGVLFIGVGYLDQEQAALAYLDEFDITYPNGPDLGSEIARRYRIRGVPETYFIASDGTVAETVIGPITTADGWTERIERIRPPTE